MVPDFGAIRFKILIAAIIGLFFAVGFTKFTYLTYKKHFGSNPDGSYTRYDKKTRSTITYYPADRMKKYENH